MRRLILLLLALPAACTAAGPQALVAHFVEDRVLVDAPLANGGTLRFFTDSGGGGTLVTQAAAQRLGLATTPASGDTGNLPPGTRIAEASLPLAPSALPAPPTPAYVVASTVFKDMPSDSDGTLGNNWFAGHVWTWDYVAGTLALEPAGWTPSPGARVVPIGLRPASANQPTFVFPRIDMTIAGEPAAMLLDTGATTFLTPEAAQRLGGPRVRSTSMIVASRVKAWRKAHPDWPVIEHAQAGTGSRMIEVPDVRVAGLQVGPVWFTERPDSAYEWMSGMMDRPVVGSIGGNAFHTLTMTLDYPRGRAAFTRGKP